MKKVFALMSLATVLAFTACGPSEEEKKKAEEKRVQDSIDNAKKLQDSIDAAQNLMNQQTTEDTTVKASTDTTVKVEEKAAH